MKIRQINTVPSRVYIKLFLIVVLLTLFLSDISLLKNWPRFHEDKHSDKVSLSLDQNCAF